MKKGQTPKINKRGRKKEKHKKNTRKVKRHPKQKNTYSKIKRSENERNRRVKEKKLLDQLHKRVSEIVGLRKTKISTLHVAKECVEELYDSNQSLKTEKKKLESEVRNKMVRLKSLIQNGKTKRPKNKSSKRFKNN